jgi:predicted nucleotidyltransferase
MSTESLGTKLRNLREINQLPLRKVAALIDIDVAILSKMERGERRLTKEVVQALARLYNHDLKELMVLYLSGKVVYEIGGEELALQALKVAEEQIAYRVLAIVDKEVIIKEFAGYFQKSNYVSKAWIFGSFARAEDDSKSDIDLMIRVPENLSFSLFDLAEIQHELEMISSGKVDVVMERAIKREIMARIKPDLKLIYER